MLAKTVELSTFLTNHSIQFAYVQLDIFQTDLRHNHLNNCILGYDLRLYKLHSDHKLQDMGRNICLIYKPYLANNQHL